MSILPGPVGAEAGVHLGDRFSHQSVTQGRPFLEFEQTVVGDSATYEIQIVPNKGSPQDEASLLAVVPAFARRKCGQKYQINSTKYFKGTEATSNFLGIPHPWLRAEVRCPVGLHAKGDPRTDLIVAVSQEIPDAEYFDIHEKDYTVGVDQLRAVVEKIVAAHGLSIMKSFRSNDMDVIVTNRSRRGPLRLYEQLIAVLAKSDNGSVLTVRLLVYNLRFEDRSGVPVNARLTPTRRDGAYQRARSFFEDVAKALES
jgi:hypothetical protein